MLIAETATLAAVLVALITAFLGRGAPGSFAAYLARLRLRSGERGIDAVIAWIAARRVDAQDRQDVAHTVILEALKTWSRFDPSRAPDAQQALFKRWLHAITRHMISRHRGKGYRRVEIPYEEPIPPSAPDPSPSPSELIAVEEERLGVIEDLQRVDVELRAVLVAHDLEGIPIEELAELHGMPPSTLYKHRARAMVALREAIDERVRRERRRERERARRGARQAR